MVVHRSAGPAARCLGIWMVAAILVQSTIDCSGLISLRGIDEQASPWRGFDIKVDDSVWFSGGGMAFHINSRWCGSEDGSLVLQEAGSYLGVDQAGPYRSVYAGWDCYGVPVETEVKQYRNIPALVLTQRFPYGANDTAVESGVDAVLSSFPRLLLQDRSDLGFMTWGTEHIKAASFGLWSSSTPNSTFMARNDGGPFLVFDAAQRHAVVISSAANFMAASSQVSQGAVSFGIKGSITQLPPGFSVDTLFYAGDGIMDAAMNWGNYLLQRYGKNRHNRQDDYTMRYLGYMTDNGAYYYYQTLPEQNYQETYYAVSDYARQEGLPYRWINIDSFFYPKGSHGGVVDWYPEKKHFPDGFLQLKNHTGWALQAHNRYWDSETVYASANGGNFTFLIDPEVGRAMPVEKRFWTWLMARARNSWGLDIYEQDWLHNESEDIAQSRRSATLSRQWLLQMGTAADEHSIKVQYCMAFPRHVLQSVEIPAVSYVRASDDYQPNKVQQWRIGVSSLLAHPLGLAPHKDTWWSRVHQPGNHYWWHPIEPLPMRQAVVSTFSTGPVGPGDEIHGSNTELIMRCCRADGRVLKPSAPAIIVPDLVVDAAFHGPRDAPGNEVWSTFSTLGVLRWDHVVVLELHHNLTLPLHRLAHRDRADALASERPRCCRRQMAAARAAEAGAEADAPRLPRSLQWDGRPLPLETLEEAAAQAVMTAAAGAAEPQPEQEERRVVFRTGPVAGQPDSAELQVELVGMASELHLPETSLHELHIFHAAPVLPASGLAILGEPDKYVAFSPDRFSSLQDDRHGVSLLLEGSPGETVTVAFVHAADMAYRTARCTLGSNPRVTLHLPSGACRDA